MFRVFDLMKMFFKGANMFKLKKIAIFTLVMALGVSMCGCNSKSNKDSKSKDDNSKNAGLEDGEMMISINSDLTILLTMKDSFNEAYYDIDELESMVDTELSKFNSTLASDPLVGITKESVESDGGNSIIKLKFQNYFDLNTYYANYINKKKTFTMFVGSYDESVNAGITINSTIYNNDEEKAAMNLEEIPTSGYVIFYINSGETVEFADTIVGVSESVTVSGNQVTTTNGVDNYVILQPANVTANTDETESVDMETTVTDTTTVAQ